MKQFILGVIILSFCFPSNSFGYTVLKTFHKDEYGPGGLAYDEVTDTLWASDLIAKTILNIDPDTGGIIVTRSVTYNSFPTGLTYKDGYLWNSDQWAVPEVIHKVNPANGASVGTIPGLGGLTFDHRGWLWSTNWDIQLRALDPIDGSLLDTITLVGFNPSYDQIMGLAFDNDTETLWVSVIEDRMNPPAQNWLLNIALDGTVLSTEEFDPNPALDGYEIGGLAFDNNSGTLWVNYSYFDKPPTVDDTYIYQLSSEPSTSPHISGVYPRQQQPTIYRSYEAAWLSAALGYTITPPRWGKVAINGSNFGPERLAGDQVRIGDPRTVAPIELQYDTDGNPYTVENIYGGVSLYMGPWSDNIIGGYLYPEPGQYLYALYGPNVGLHWLDTYLGIWVVKDNSGSPAASNVEPIRVITPLPD